MANVVLLHGFLGSYWCRAIRSDDFNGVGAALRSRLGLRVLAVSNPGLLRLHQRSVDAAKQISEAITRGTLNASEPIHILAHSTGGLDARYVLSNDIYGLAGRVATLTCIGTPHWGTPIAGLLTGCLMSLITPDAVRELSEASARHLDRRCDDIPSVQYFEVAGVGKLFGSPMSFVFGPSQALLRLSGAGDNDGLVPLSSASRGRRPLQVWTEDHIGLIGASLEGSFGRPEYPHVARYEELIRRVTSG